MYQRTLNLNSTKSTSKTLSFFKEFIIKLNEKIVVIEVEICWIQISKISETFIRAIPIVVSFLSTKKDQNFVLGVIFCKQHDASQSNITKLSKK